MSAAAYNQGMRRRESFFRITEDTAHTPNESNTTPSPTTEPMNGVRANSSMTRDAEQVRRMMDAAKTGNEARIDWSSRMTDEQIAELSADNPPKPRIAEGPSLQRESIPFPDLGLPVRQSPPDSVANHTQQVTEPSQPAQTECEIVQSEVTHSRPSIAEPENQLQSELVAVPATNPAITAEISAEEIAPEPLVSADVSPASPANVLLETTTDTQLEPATVATPTVTPIPEYEANHTAEPVAEATPVESTPAVSPRTIDPSQYRRAEQHIVDQAAEVVEKSAKNGHQKMTVELPTAANYPYQQVTPVAHAKTIIEDKKQESLFIGRPKRERRRIGKVALSTVVALGALTGLGLYAGGADLVSTWFTHRPEGPQAATQTAPRVASAPSVSALPTPVQPQLGQTANIEVISSSSDTGVVASASASGVPAVGGGKASDSVVANSSASAPIRATEAPAQPHPELQPTQEPTVAAAPVAATPATTASRVVVQVRATPDPVEAKRIARKLRSTGITTVSVMEADNRSTTLHRIRFEFAGSKEEAIAAAGRAGYSDVWVVKQK